MGDKLKFPKWVANDLREPIAKLFNLVAREGFSASWTTNVIQITFECKKKNKKKTKKKEKKITLGNYKTIMLGTSFSRLVALGLSKKIS
jgi:hypothetical protein